LRGIAILTTSLVFLPACQSISFPADAKPLSEVNAAPLKYKDKLIKVCGYATNQFENLQITENRDRDWRDEPTAGLAVDWLEEETRTDGVEKRCVTGQIEPTCGWEHGLPGDNNDIICLSTGSIYQWKIRQTQLGRN
jgi:hypothetical protein